MKFQGVGVLDVAEGRAPRGARGLKFGDKDVVLVVSGRAPRGARGLKLPGLALRGPTRGRAPRGARGLKFVPPAAHDGPAVSRPSRGAWVEIAYAALSNQVLSVAPLTGRVG